MYRRLLDIVHGWRDPQKPKPTILVVGDLMVDSYLYGDAERLSPEAPVPVLNIERQEMRPGGAAAVANNLLALNADVICCGLIGEDDAGRFLLQQLSNRGADVSGVVQLDNYHTIIKQRLVGLAQGRIPQQLLRADYECNGPMDGRLAEQVAERVSELADRAAVLVVEDYDKGLINESMIRRLLARCRGLRIGMVVDPARLADYARYAGADWITPNRAETALVTGVKIDSADLAEKAARMLLEKGDFKAVALTLDRDGILAMERDGRCRHLLTHAREVYDVTGAGDMVLATLAMARASGADLFDAAALANVAAGLEVERFGSEPIYPEEIAEHLISRHREHVGKIISIDELLPELDVQRKLGRKIVFTNGCFDLLHPGHVSYLEFAARQGDMLVVGMNSDRSVRILKGENRPITPQIDRARMLAALEVVDYVVIFDDPSVESLVRQVRPDVLVKGEDWGYDGVVGREFVESYGGRIALAKLERQYSTTRIINRIVERAKGESGNAE